MDVFYIFVQYLLKAKWSNVHTLTAIPYLFTERVLVGQLSSSTHCRSSEVCTSVCSQAVHVRLYCNRCNKKSRPCNRYLLSREYGDFLTDYSRNNESVMLQLLVLWKVLCNDIFILWHLINGSDTSCITITEPQQQHKKRWWWGGGGGWWWW